MSADRDGLVAYIVPEEQLVAQRHRLTGVWTNGERHERGAWDSEDAALQWARARAPEVVVVVRHRVSPQRVVLVGDIPLLVNCPVERHELTFSIGVVHTGDTALGEWPRALPAPPRRHPNFGGSVHLAFNDVSQPGNDLGYVTRLIEVGVAASAMTAVAGPAWAEDLPGALAAAGAEASRVLLTLGPPAWEHWSAGERDFDASELPRWIPEAPEKGMVFPAVD
jgi:hypothetical protein